MKFGEVLVGLVGVVRLVRFGVSVVGFWWGVSVSVMEVWCKDYV